MKIALLMTGDELLSGNIVDTNAAWLADQCWMLGHEIVRKLTVGDDGAAIGDACQDLAARADVVIVSGGLGPTSDDITVESAAKAFGAQLVLDPKVWQGIQDLFKSRGRECTANNKRQAMLPVGATALHNSVGSAPGVQWTVGQTTFFFLPGVPRELKQIFSDHVHPWLKAQAATPYFEHRLHCIGMPEATIDQTLQALDLGPIRLSYRAHFPEVMLKVVGRGVGAESAVTAAAAKIRQALGTVVYGEAEASLPEAVGQLLCDRGETLAIAESCTGGYLSNQLTDIPGASAWFERGGVCYSNSSKIDWLSQPHSGVEGGTHTALPGGGATLAHIIEAHGAVSRECAEAMAAGIRKVAGTTYGISVTGIAGPSGGTVEKPVGTVFIGLADSKGVSVTEHHYPQGRDIFKVVVSATALNMLRLHLKYPLPPGEGD